MDPSRRAGGGVPGGCVKAPHPGFVSVPASLGVGAGAGRGGGSSYRGRSHGNRGLGIEGKWVDMVEGNRAAGSPRWACGRVGGQWCMGTDPQSPAGVSALSHCWCRRDGPGESEKRGGGEEKDKRVKVPLLAESNYPARLRPKEEALQPLQVASDLTIKPFEWMFHHY